MMLLVVTSRRTSRANRAGGEGTKAIAHGKVAWGCAWRPASDKQFSHGGSGFTGRALCGLLHSGFGAYTSGEKQSLTVLNLETNELRDFSRRAPGGKGKASVLSGLAFSVNGKHLFASMASLTDPLGKEKGSTGNGIAVYGFEEWSRNSGEIPAADSA